MRATRLLGAQIRQARRERRWSTSELAERAGITRPTLHKLEAGEPTVGLGIAFETAALLGVPLFREDRERLSIDAELTRERLAVLPQRIRRPARDVDDDF
ncbi:MAG TPA: helix-turn-helix transcriptional regulator [Solirubrobacteraceae bacterium]|nr:helix-turn-helix transcriptional regulator [Solirubrobacteraceae bacterium]